MSDAKIDGNDRVFSALVIEDEAPARELLGEFIRSRPDLSLEGEARNGEEALEILRSYAFDLVFLDINLPVLSGIEVLERLESIPRIIFTTAYDRYAVHAFELGAVDYLKKPFTRERFDQAVNRAIERMAVPPSASGTPASLGLSFKEKGTQYLVAHEDIVYLASEGKRTQIHAEGRTFVSPVLLHELVQRLPPASFQRIHKRFCVNLRKISRMDYDIGGAYLLTLNDEEQTALPVGRSFAEALKRRLNPR